MCIGNRFVPIVYKLLLLSAVLSGLYLSIFHLSDGFNGLALRYFTIQSNILVALAILFFLIYPRETRLRAIIRGSVLLSILVTGLVFHFILVPQLSDYFVGGIDLVNHLTHTIAPLGFILDWLLFDRKGQLKLADLPFWVIYCCTGWLLCCRERIPVSTHIFLWMSACSATAARCSGWRPLSFSFRCSACY